MPSRERKPEKRQEDILSCIQRSLRERGFPPSVRELQRACGLKSPSSVHYHLKKLEAQGAIARNPQTSRSIVLAGRPVQSVSVPLVGQVRAGQPVLAEENLLDRLSVPEDLTRGEGSFALKVHGDSMIGAGILDGDTVILTPTPTVESGAIAVVLVDGEATVKRVFHERGALRLQPENPSYPPILTRNASVVGRVVGLLRHYA